MVNKVTIEGVGSTSVGPDEDCIVLTGTTTRDDSGVTDLDDNHLTISDLLKMASPDMEILKWQEAYAFSRDDPEPKWWQEYIDSYTDRTAGRKFPKKYSIKLVIEVEEIFESSDK